MATDIKTVMATNTEYPCCGKALRFHPGEDELPKIKRHCTSCRVHWLVFREPGPVEKGSPIRVDRLHWEVDV